MYPVIVGGVVLVVEVVLVVTVVVGDPTIRGAQSSRAGPDFTVRAPNWSVNGTMNGPAFGHFTL